MGFCKNYFTNSEKLASKFYAVVFEHLIDAFTTLLDTHSRHPCDWFKTCNKQHPSNWLAEEEESPQVIDDSHQTNNDPSSSTALKEPED